MIQTLPCPSCHRVLVLTAETSLQAVLRCRHCSHQFQLGEMIEAELGFWEVVDDPNAPEPKFAVGNESTADDADIELAKEEYMSPQMLLKAEAEKKKTDWSKFEPITHEQFERMRRKGKSPIWSALSVLFGGLAAIPIATLLIWHVLGKDPLQMGPVVARFAPWIVPTRFRPSNYAADEMAAPPPPGASGLPRVDVSGVAPGSNASGIPSISPRSHRNRRVPGAFPAPSINAGLEDETEPGQTEAAPPVEPDSEPIPVDVFSAINTVETDLEAWSERGEDIEIRNQIAVRTYTDLSALALAINQLPSPSPIRRLVRTELNAVGKEVEEHGDVQELIEKGAVHWLNNRKEDLLGLAMVINVAGLNEVDKVWQVTTTTKLGEQAIQIEVPKEIVPSLSEGQKLLAIGCLTREKNVTSAEASEATAKPTPKFTASYGYVLKP